MKKLTFAFSLSFLIISCDFFSKKKEEIPEINTNVIQNQEEIVKDEEFGKLPEQPHKSFSDFIKELPTLTFPIKTQNFPNKTNFNYLGYFDFEKYGNYYTLDFETYSVLGKYSQDNTFFVLYRYTLWGEGEGYYDDMITLFAYSESGKIIDKIHIGGSYGGEGGYTEFSSEIHQDKIIRKSKDELSSEYLTNTEENLVKYYTETFSFSKDYFYPLTVSHNCSDKNFSIFNTFEKDIENTDIYEIKEKIDFFKEAYLQCKKPSVEQVLKIINFFAQNHSESLDYSYKYYEYINELESNNPEVLMASANNFWEYNLFVSAYKKYQEYLQTTDNKSLDKTTYATKKIAIPEYLQNEITKKQPQKLIYYLPMKNSQENQIFLLVFSPKNEKKYWDICVYVQNSEKFIKFQNENYIPTTFSFYQEKDLHNSYEKCGDFYLQDTTNPSKMYGIHFIYPLKENNGLGIYKVEEFLYHNDIIRSLRDAYKSEPFETSPELNMEEISESEES